MSDTVLGSINILTARKPLSSRSWQSSLHVEAVFSIEINQKKKLNLLTYHLVTQTTPY